MQLFFYEIPKKFIYIVSRDLGDSIYSICIVYYVLLFLECRDDNKQLKNSQGEITGLTYS